MKEFTGEKDFIPFSYQGQYEDVEIGLYYNRFLYYDPEQGNYTQIDPIGLAGGNPTLYGYVNNTNFKIDPFGLDELYALIAKQDGWYDVMEWGKKNPVGQMFLKEGELWKIGTSKNASSRYTQKYLNSKGVEMKVLHSNVSNGTVKYHENMKIRGYEQWKGFLPPGNKCRH
ncbi:RHS repeat-associated core domain-containing protein [Lysinibacillus capsici]|uniref:RHS repeat-associated core domain-containing protein n=1 Tax=Lysinibacillus capsici TaxID=2115968 RepID=UPI002E202EFC|nr:RHS repeat-associated core domain-containing protein [Lysinibacillus capsici]